MMRLSQRENEAEASNEQRQRSADPVDVRTEREELQTESRQCDETDEEVALASSDDSRRDRKGKERNKMPNGHSQTENQDRRIQIPGVPDHLLPTFRLPPSPSLYEHFDERQR